MGVESPDYDKPRPTLIPSADDEVEDLKASRASRDTTAFGLDDELPGFDPLASVIAEDELTTVVVPVQSDEFRCQRCFLVYHRQQRSTQGEDVCAECS